MLLFILSVGLGGVPVVKRNKNIEPVVGIALSLRGAIIGLFFGLVSGFVGGLTGGVRNALIGGLLGVLSARTSRTAGTDLRESRRMNEGVVHSARLGLTLGLVSGLGSGLVSGLTSGLLAGVFVGLLNGLVSGLVFGGFAVVQHAILRWLLARTGVVPLDLIRFLDYAADHILLQKVGSGYRFIHILMHDYFAALSTML